MLKDGKILQCWLLKSNGRAWKMRYGTPRRNIQMTSMSCQPGRPGTALSGSPLLIHMCRRFKGYVVLRHPHGGVHYAPVVRIRFLLNHANFTILATFFFAVSLRWGAIQVDFLT